MKEKPWQLGRQLWLKKAADGNIPWSNTLQSIRISSRRWRQDASGHNGDFWAAADRGDGGKRDEEDHCRYWSHTPSGARHDTKKPQKAEVATH